MQALWWFPFGRVEEISPRELDAQLKDGARVQVLDVREHFEFREGHIRNAKNMPLHDLARNVENLDFDPEWPVVVICLSGHRSIPAYRLLKRKGYTQIYSLKGGMLAWWNAHLPTTREGNR